MGCLAGRHINIIDLVADCARLLHWLGFPRNRLCMLAATPQQPQGTPFIYIRSRHRRRYANVRQTRQRGGGGCGIPPHCIQYLIVQLIRPRFRCSTRLMMRCKNCTCITKAKPVLSLLQHKAQGIRMKDKGTHSSHPRLCTQRTATAWGCCRTCYPRAKRFINTNVNIYPQYFIFSPITH